MSIKSLPYEGKGCPKCKDRAVRELEFQNRPDILELKSQIFNSLRSSKIENSSHFMERMSERCFSFKQISMTLLKGEVIMLQKLALPKNYRCAIISETFDGRPYHLVFSIDLRGTKPEVVLLTIYDPRIKSYVFDNSLKNRTCFCKKEEWEIF